MNARPVNPYNYSNISGSAGTQLSAQQAWAIDLDSLETRPDMGRGNQLMVRLVRPLPSAPPDEKAEAPARPAPTGRTRTKRTDAQAARSEALRLAPSSGLCANGSVGLRPCTTSSMRVWTEPRACGWL